MEDNGDDGFRCVRFVLISNSASTGLVLETTVLKWKSTPEAGFIMRFGVTGFHRQSRMLERGNHFCT
jgi:hypothetical protein